MNALLGVIFHSIGAIVPSIYYSINPTLGKVSFTHMMTFMVGIAVILASVFLVGIGNAM
jgi:hypothetical protein